MMRVRIERVVDRHTLTRTECFVISDDRIAAAVSENEIVLRYQIEKRIGTVGLDAVQRRRRINVPEDGYRMRLFEIEHCRFEQVVVNTSPARLHEHVDTARLFERTQNTSFVA